ncbi:fungal-specific transcription factor domain-containing protein [Cristinia sonorae]|uniref:Fungal-specific transcription factor domain-containing protein n=1 Tax=Cristinia sonorae TaxID=1940300 RepID=A0A8K0UZC7_9AGAR|nr:fungal-specific transcription factor domain-containing protein [Cristinia sonorae]
MNGHPYHSAPSPFHQPGSAPVNGQTGPGIPPGHPQYPHAMHYPPYAHGYPSYPQYPPTGMMMYSAAPGPSQQEHQRSAEVQSPVASASSTTGKRKRYDGPRPGGGQGSSAGAEAKKRTKTQRACDSCRSRKIRCDVLVDSDPPKCQHCNQYGFECTFFLPITETRFKKKKLEEEAAATVAADKDKEPERGTSSPHGDKPGDPRVLGPTSALHLLHSSAMISSRTYETYDSRYHHTWDVSANGDGVIQVNEPKQSDLHLALPKPADLRIERDIVEKLVNSYFTEVAPMLPIVRRNEFVAASPPPAVLLYSICMIAATRREVPQAVFDSIRYAVNAVIKAEDVLSTPSIVNVQALLILSMSGDCHSHSIPNALSALWIRLGTAIRMAKAVKQNIELRRRLWGICVISDRWISLTYGHPYMIDVRDCDARLPSSGDPADIYMDELVRLSVILGRVYKAIYTPAGLNATTDEELQELLSDLESWKQNLPEDLQFRGPDTPRTAGLLFLFYSTVNMIFWRVFMRISYSCPVHLKFCLTVEKWTELVQLTSDAIDWLDANDRAYDVWLLVAYCATSSALVQYHTWARRKDLTAQAQLRKLRDCVRKWEGSLSPDHMSTRRKTSEIIALLYESTQGPQHPLEPPALNPTGGVKVKPPTEGLTFRKDPSRPGGGVFIANEQPKEEVVRDLPEGLIIHDSQPEGESDMNSSSQSRTENNVSLLSRVAASLSTLYAPSTTRPSGLVQEQQRQHAQQQAQIASSASAMVNLTPLGPNFPNMNPAMNTASSSSGKSKVQVMNMLDVPQAQSQIEQYSMADSFLDGIPGSMLDWNQWENYFSRVIPANMVYQQQAAASNPSAGQQPSQAQGSQSQYQYQGGST